MPALVAAILAFSNEPYSILGISLAGTRLANAPRAHLADLSNVEHQPHTHHISYQRKLLFAALGGLAGAFAVYPLDLAKSVLQDQIIVAGQAPQYRGLVDVLRQNYRRYGVPGLYRGLSANMIGIIPEKATKFFVNDLVRGWFHCDTKGKGCSIAAEVLAGGAAGLSQQIFTVPMELFKIIMQTRKEGEVKANLLTLVTQKIRTMGLRGMYTGTAATLLRDIPFSCIYFSLYGKLKRDLENKQHRPLRAHQRLYASTIAGVLASALATPMDVIKTRRQANPSAYPSVGLTVRRILKEESPTAFFKGVGPRVLIISPLFGIAMMVYETLQSQFPGKHD